MFRTLLLATGVALAITAGIQVEAFAQVAAVAPGAGDVALPATDVVSDPSLVGEWWQALWSDLKGPLITLAVAIVGFFLRKFVNDATARTLQQMLQDAAGRAAGVVVAENPAILKQAGPINPVGSAVKPGVNYLEKTMGGTIAKIEKATGKTLPLGEIVSAHLGRLIASGGKAAN